MNVKQTMTYSEAIEKVLMDNNYFAPLKKIYREITKYRLLTGKTPFNTIQERSQRDPRFTRIGLGVYALTKYLDKLPKITSPKTESEKKERLHTKIQGMLIEIGNNRNEVEDTYTNDKKCIFDNKTLGSLATLPEIPPFTYEHIINETVRFFDVIWFNRRGYPLTIFEVEHSTDFRDAFIKFTELQDFRTRFCCVSFNNRKDKFDKEIGKTAFEPLKDRCEFISYDKIEHDYKLSLDKTYL